MAQQGLRYQSGFVLLCYKGAIFHKQGSNVRRTLLILKAGLKISLVFPHNCVVGV